MMMPFSLGLPIVMHIYMGSGGIRLLSSLTLYWSQGCWGGRRERERRKRKNLLIKKARR